MNIFYRESLSPSLFALTCDCKMKLYRVCQLHEPFERDVRIDGPRVLRRRRP